VKAAQTRQTRRRRYHDVVDVGGLVTQVVEALLVAPDAEEHVVVEIIVAAVEPIERADEVVFCRRR
jgi:hypothetical protein